MPENVVPVSEGHCEVRPHVTSFGVVPAAWEDRSECAEPAVLRVTFGEAALMVCERHGQGFAAGAGL